LDDRVSAPQGGSSQFEHFEALLLEGSPKAESYYFVPQQNCWGAYENHFDSSYMRGFVEKLILGVNEHHGSVRIFYTAHDDCVVERFFQARLIFRIDAYDSLLQIPFSQPDASGKNHSHQRY
jgi:hypothetical protein